MTLKKGLAQVLYLSPYGVIRIFEYSPGNIFFGNPHRKIIWLSFFSRETVTRPVHRGAMQKKDLNSRHSHVISVPKMHHNTSDLAVQFSCNVNFQTGLIVRIQPFLRLHFALIPSFPFMCELHLQTHYCRTHSKKGGGLK